jgi:hypothetical protein
MPPATRMPGARRAKLPPTRDEKQQHPSRNRDGSKGKAASLLVVGAGRETGEDDRDRSDRDEQGGEARQEARGNVPRNFRIDRSPRRSFLRLNRGCADAGRLRVGFGRVRPHRH